MFKKSFAVVIASLALLISACSETTEPQLGKHYQELPSDLSDVITEPVVEVFSLTCGHCMNLEKELPAIKQAFGGDIGKVHVTFNDSSRSAAMFFYAGISQLGDQVPQSFIDGLFNLYHGPFETSEQRVTALNKVFADANITSPYELSEDQVQQVLESAKIAEIVTSRGRINAVPTFIVNGKYQVDLSAHQSAEDIGQTIKYLTQK